MKEFKGTKGRWKLIYHEDGHYSDDAVITSTYRVGMIEIAKIHGAHPDSGFDDEFQQEQSANAHLIAASPYLLSALQQLLEIYDDQSGKVWTTPSKRRALDNARAAVNKALGETK